MLETIILDGSRMTSRKAAHDHLSVCLGLPDTYGRNLDALYDVLTERGTPTRLVVFRREMLLAGLGDYGASLLETLEDADRENPALQVLYENDF